MSAMAATPSTPPGSADELRERVAAVRQRIERAGGDPGRVRLVTVTKGFDVAVVRLALQASLVDLGENYAQELLAKHEQLGSVAGSPPSWHFIGRLQRNKVAKLAPVVAVWQSVDRPALGGAIARHAPGAAVFAQVNVSGEAQKGGCPPADTASLVAGLRAEGLDVRGLMAVGATGSPEAARSGFRLLRRATDELGLAECSMGMSNDLEVAVSEGSTMVRVGTALLGARPTSLDVRN